MLSQDSYGVIRKLQELLSQLREVQFDESLKVHDSLMPTFANVLTLLSTAEVTDDDDLAIYITEQYDLLISKLVRDTCLAPRKLKESYLTTVLKPGLELSAIWPSPRSRNFRDSRWWHTMFHNLIEGLISSSKAPNEAKIRATIEYLNLSLEDNVYLSEKFLLSLENLQITEETHMLDIFGEILLSIDVDLIIQCYSRTPDIKRIARDALKVLLNRDGNSKHQLLSHITVEHTQLFDTPVELLIEMADHYKWLSRRDSDPVRRFDFLPRLYQFIENERTISNLVDIITPNSLLSMVFESMSPEALNMSQELSAFRSMLQGLIKFMNPTQLYYYFRKALVLACILPPHRTLWLVQYAQQLLERHPMIIIPTIHVNPSLADHINIDLNCQNPLAKLPQELPQVVGKSNSSDSASTTLPLTSLRCCQNPCIELMLLNRHSSAAVRELSAAITKFLTKVDAVSKPSSHDNLDLSWYQIADGGLKRAIKRLEVATELFSR